MELGYKSKFLLVAASVATATILGLAQPIAAQATAAPAIAAVSANQFFNPRTLSTVHLDGQPLAGFTGTIEVRISVQSGEGLVHVTNASGMRLLPGYPDAVAGNVASLGYSGSQDDANAMLATLQYLGDRNTGADNIRIDVSNQSAGVYGGHAYSLVNFTISGRLWSAALSLASRASIQKAGGGTCPGYLATLNGNGVETRQKGAFEQAFLANAFPATRQTWIGASDESNEGSWRWVSDPDDPESIFWLGGANGVSQNGFKANWQTGEPNNMDGIENYAHVIDSSGTWNDAESLSTAWSYYLEFGSASCVPQIVADNEVVQIASLETVAAPGEVTNLKVERLSKSATLSWAAPVEDGGSEITGYEIQWKYSLSSDWVELASAAQRSFTASIPGVQPTLPYRFRVRALNGLSVSDWSYVELPEPRGPRFSSPPNGSRRLVSNSGGIVEFNGSNLDAITSVRLASKELGFSATAGDTIRVTVPAGSGSPDLLFVSPFGNVIFQNAFTYSPPAKAYPTITKRFSGRSWSRAVAKNINNILLSASGYGRVRCEIVAVPSAKALNEIMAYCKKLKDSTYFTQVSVRDSRLPRKTFAHGYSLKFVINK